MMDRVPAVRTNPLGTHLPRHSRSIEFRNICFSFTPDRAVLENISFKVHHGETVAVIGPNGCGKTTLLSLLPRFFDPDHGVILLDGVNIRNAHLRSLRKQIGIVTQEAVLFEDTIYNNIAYGCAGATPSQVEEAAKKAFAHDFIMSLSEGKGYSTMLTERGQNLSGGEKQRIALARAILRNPSVLILDEFTSAIDPISDSLIHQSLREFKQGRTTLLITHRMHTLEIADRIVVMNEGRIESIGTHAELLMTSALYSNLQEAQIQRRVA